MKNVLKKSIGILLAGTMLFSSALGVTASAETATAVATVKTSEKTYTVKKRSVPLYSTWGDVRDEDKDTAKTTLYFVNGSDVPYIDIETIRTDCLYLHFADYTAEIADSFKYIYDGDKVKFVCEGNIFFEMDFSKDTITFEDYDGFKSLSRFVMDFVVKDIFFDEKGNPQYFNRSDEFLRTGNEIVFDLGAYNIDLVRYGKKYLIPLQTYSDIFGTPIFPIFYNGKAVFKLSNFESQIFDDQGKLTDLGKKYYKGSTGKFSKSTVRFAYNELCFALDHFYGNKELHKITSFDEYFKQTGLYSYLRNRDPKKVETGLFLLANYLSDGHTAFVMSSSAAGKDYSNDLISNYDYSSEINHYLWIHDDYLDIASRFYPDGRPVYEEIGNTAFITLDSFVFDFSADYYNKKPDANATDTVGIIGYSFSRILRKNSPIKRVVLDLSCNMGGFDAAANYLTAAFIGRYNLYRNCLLTGTQEIMSIEADTNFDGVFDKKDSLTYNGIRIYCIISEGGFSNGSKVPAMLKNSGLVTLVGRKTSGGAYNVGRLSTAYGSGFWLSYIFNDCDMINGTFYNIDAGVEPHIYINNLSNFYDRKKLMEYLDNLL